MNVRTLRIVCWVLFLGPILSYLVWVVFPRQTHRALVDRSVEASDARFLEAQRQAEDPELNGYLSETFLPLWGGETSRDETSEVRSVLKAWTERLDEGLGKPLFHFAMRRMGDPKYAKAQAGFAKLVPELQKQAAMPIFAPVYSDAAG